MFETGRTGKFAKIEPRLRIVIGDIRTVGGFSVMPSVRDLNRILFKKRSVMMDDHTGKLMDAAGKMAEVCVQPAAVYGLFPPENISCSALQDSSLVGLALVTIGPALEMAVERARESGELALATVLDAYGSAWVEGAVEAVQQVIILESEQIGMKWGKRKSPGFPTWPLENQRELLTILHSGRIGVTLNAACMMMPRKSVSFGMPLREKREVTGKSISP
ncbi:hypothetical protein JXA40_08130 [bacterium]|nr:hypothetical protein [candidate division CSSED10-310 bacterium]